jgi:hypothetical protein
MRQRGRQPAAAADVVAFPRVDGLPSRLNPPPTLRKDERAIFVQVVGACDPRHFSEADLPLLVSLAQATARAHRTARGPDKAVWEKAVRLQMALARSLRITPQARMDPKLARLQPGNAVSYYDRMRDEP